MAVTRTRVAIVGAGFAGIGAAIRLLQAGERDFVVLERADDVGGVWRDNRYPGCACDVQSHLYCFSFAPHPTWSHAYSPRAEIHAYLRDCVARFGVTPHLRLGHALQGARWDEDEHAWRLTTSQGTFIADVFVAALGALSEPKLPDVPGLESFEGRAVHSARWPDDLELDGKRVAIVGTGASAAQIVPAIQPRVSHLTLFQRTPAWVMPRDDHEFTSEEKARFSRSKTAMRMERGKLFALRETIASAFVHPRTIGKLGERVARRTLAEQVPDEALRARLTPTYGFGCKRVVSSNDYLPSLGRANVTVTSGVREVRREGVVDEDGALHAVEVIVFATGFTATDWPWTHHAFGRAGSLAEAWQGSPRAYLGTTVAGFPNLFVIPGPNTGLGHTSVVLMAEAQIEHLLACLRELRARGARVLEPRVEAQARYVAELDARLATTVWNAGGCKSWYLDRTGRNATLWPAYTPEFRRRAARFVASDYVFDVDVHRSFDRVEAGVARALRALPPFVQRALSGGEILVDGQTLAPDVALVLAAQRALGEDALTVDSPLEARQKLRRASLLHEGERIDVQVDAMSVAGRPARRYRSPRDGGAIVLYFHGGGMVVGDLDTHDAVCRRICRDASVQVVSVDYRLAPEHPFPAAADDALAAFAWVRAHAEELGGDGRIAVAGDSAGGNLAAVVAQTARGNDGPMLQLLVYPAVDRVTSYRSFELFQVGFMLSRADVDWFDARYTGDHPELHADLRISPGLAPDLHDVAPALVYTAGFDPLRDEGERYAERLAHAGRLLEQRRFPGLVHGFIQMGAVSRSCDAALGTITRALARALLTPH